MRQGPFKDVGDRQGKWPETLKKTLLEMDV
jgi:hypothetical protein